MLSIPRQGSSFGPTCSRAEVLNWPPWLKKVVLRTEGARMLDLLKVTCRPETRSRTSDNVWADRWHDGREDGHSCGESPELE